MKNLLIAVTGLTPQIVTETLFCLAVKDKIRIDEVYVLTTKRGRDVILGLDKAASTPKTPLKNEIEKLCEDYNLELPLFENNSKHIIVAKEESVELSDIRTDKDNILFPNKAATFIREKAADKDNFLYCAITGGRKSMSVHIANALSLFARENDKLLHVLTKEEHEFKGFYPKTKKEINDLELSEIPFVRLRSLLASKYKQKDFSFDRVVKFTQKQLKLVSDQTILYCDIMKRELSFGSNKISLEPMEFLLYYFFIDKKIKGTNKIHVNDVTSREAVIQLIEYINEYFPNYYLPDNKKNNWLKDKKRDLIFRSRRSKLNKKIYTLIDDPDIAVQFIIDVEKIWGDSKYFIPAPKEKIKVNLPH